VEISARMELSWRNFSGEGVFLREKSFPRWNFSVGEGILHGGKPDFPELLRTIRN